MPANPQQIHTAFQEIGRKLAGRSESEQAARSAALQLLQACALEPASFRAAAEAGVASEPTLRCALPLVESAAAGYACTSHLPRYTVVAVDGSQSVPDRHAEVLFALINVGAVTMEMGSGRVPAVDVDTTMLFGSDLYPEDGPLLAEGEIALRRDAAERAALLRLATPASGPSVALLDGPLELWGPKEVSDADAFAMALAGYLENLRELERRDWIVAGYVDKPAADLVIRLFETGQAAPHDLKRLRHYHPLRLTSDRWLFGKILQPRQRSAIFGLQSTSTAKYTGSLALHFFYLNVGVEGHPAIARVEIPGWIAGDPRRVDVLHQALLEQCEILGARAYPYAIHRAHETASLSPAEIEQIKVRLILEMRDHGVEPEAASAKASAKRASAMRGSA
jgi:hypothetical protein